MTGKFFRTALIGAVVYILPIAAGVFLLSKIIKVVRLLTAPITKLIPAESVIGVRMETLVALVVLIVFCFLLGLIARGPRRPGFFEALDERMLIIPGYLLLRSWAKSLADLDGGNNAQVVFIKDNDAYRIAFLMETLDNGLHAVFVPLSPSVFSGYVHYLPEEHIKRTSISFRNAVRILRRTGVGSKAILKGVNMKFVIAALMLTFSACAATQVIDSWKAPDFQGPLNFKKVAVVGLSPDETTRRVMEDELVKKIGAKAVASHTFLATEDLNNLEKVKAEINSQGIDGAVTLKMVEKSKEINYTTGVYAPMGYPLYHSASFGYGYTMPTGMITTDTLVRIETNIYSIADQKLLWSGVSETFNPTSVKSSANEIADAVRKKLVKDKLLEEKRK